MVYFIGDGVNRFYGRFEKGYHIMQNETKLAEGGRIVIPSEFRQALGMNTGDKLILFMEDGELHILTLQQAIKRAQEIVRRYIPEDRSLVDELIADRRLEAENE